MSDRPRTPFTLGAIAAVLYFSEGFPFGIVNDLVPLYLRLEHIGLKTIGLASGVSIAWTLKFLWSPLVDTSQLRWAEDAVIDGIVKTSIQDINSRHHFISFRISTYGVPGLTNGHPNLSD